MEGVYSTLQILLPEGLSRNAIAFHLQNAGIQTRAWYQPLIPDHPAFSMIGAMDIPIARKLSPRMLGLPFHLMLDDLEVRYVCQVLADALSKGGN